MNKKELRAYYKTLRKALSKCEKDKLDNEITENFLSLDEYKNAQCLLCYVSSQIEVGTIAVIQTASKDGKSVYVPKCSDEGNAMTFYRIGSLVELTIGSYGILEPSETAVKYMGENALCIVPALSYDKLGYRLGFGKGYYDRFLNENKNLYPIGFCYSNCMTEKLPSEQYDIAVKKIITENLIIDIEV